MSKMLARILDQPERLVAKSIQRLEELNGFNGEDAKLLARNSQATRVKIADLGLDPTDTTGQELYHALLVRFERDAWQFDKALGVSANSTLGQKLYKSGKLISHLTPIEDIWVLKISSAKKLLKAQPPKKLMKSLHYRSVDSMLKREKADEVLSMANFMESPAWQKSVDKELAKYDGSNYELRKPKLISPDLDHWKIAGPIGPAISTNSTAGTIIAWPGEQNGSASTLALTLKIIESLEALSHRNVDNAIRHLNPVLCWWEQAKNLMAVCADEVVSFNYKDVSNAHFGKLAYERRLLENGRRSLWDELLSRYQKHETEFEEALDNATEQVVATVEKIKPRQPKLANEYAEAIANEF